MKVIFLDVDGVLNTSKTYEKINNSFKTTGKKELDIDGFRLEYLKRIIDETDAKIVLSSTWRKSFEKQNNKLIPRTEKGKRFLNILDEYEIKLFDIIDNDFYENRENLINFWLSKNDVESFIIIDDEPNLFNILLDRLIKTSRVKNNEMLMNMDDCYGLCEYHIEIAKDMLKSKVKIKK